MKERVEKTDDSCILEMITFYIPHNFSSPSVHYSVLRIVEGLVKEEISSSNVAKKEVQALGETLT